VGSVVHQIQLRTLAALWSGNDAGDRNLRADDGSRFYWRARDSALMIGHDQLRRQARNDDRIGGVRDQVRGLLGEQSKALLILRRVVGAESPVLARGINAALPLAGSCRIVYEILRLDPPAIRAEAAAGGRGYADS
jgi:hypothetical protein